jgi:hypothetical protein
MQRSCCSRGKPMDLLYLLVVIAFFAPFVIATAHGASEE